ncbi:MAG: acyl carrier protein [Pirellulaceae bacterium]|nr:acyl carrier protein [Pirellulaceae bacterium]
MTSSRLPYSLKILVSATIIAGLIVGIREARKHWPVLLPAAVPGPAAEAPSGLYADSLARVQEIIAVHTASVPEVASPSMPLVDLGIDPLTRVEVADALETAFQISLPSEELSAAATVDDLVRLVVKQQQNAQVHAKRP